jgi:5-methyltetrahydrofolate--homocysteine methyltransferase
MKTIDLLQALVSRPLLCDGAMGTQLQERGLAPGQCGEQWNINAPGRVEEVHRSYAEAGCDLITTNTFGGTRLALARHGLEQRVTEFNRAGAILARRASGEGRWILGDVGPVGDLLEPFGGVSVDAAAAAFEEQAAALLAGGADAILVETMSDPEEAAIAVQSARAAGAGVVMATFAFQRTSDAFRTMMGTTVKDCLEKVIDAGADIVGANCGTNLTLSDYEQLARELVSLAAGRPVILQPNAGAPVLVDGRAVYRESPGQLAEAAGVFRAAGVRIVGGCCGTTPAHLAAMAVHLAG